MAVPHAHRAGCALHAQEEQHPVGRDAGTFQSHLWPVPRRPPEGCWAVSPPTASSDIRATQVMLTAGGGVSRNVTTCKGTQA